MKAMGVVGLGNPLCGDDGAGVALVAALRARKSQRWLCEVGSDLLALQSQQPYPAALLFVDAMVGLPPGKMQLFTLEEIVTMTGRSSMAVHGLTSGERLGLLLALDGHLPRRNSGWLAIGSGQFTTPFHLSPPVAATVARLVDWLLGEAEVSGELHPSPGAFPACAIRQWIHHTNAHF